LGRVISIVGIFLALFGWFRIISPHGTGTIFGQEIVNMHELTIFLATVITGSAIALAGLIQHFAEAKGKSKVPEFEKVESNQETVRLTASLENVDLPERAAALRRDINAAQAKLQK
jgi:TRAP-type C4-dicarboxylate transport system permease small subunit